MTGWYVDAAADPGGDGSLDTPWDALNDIVYGGSGVDSGDTLFLEGEFTVMNQSTALDIISQSFSSEVKVRGGVFKQAATPVYDFNVWIQDTSNVVLENMDIRSSNARPVFVQANGADITKFTAVDLRVDNNDGAVASAHGMRLIGVGGFEIHNATIKSCRFTRAGLAGNRSNTDGLNCEDCDTNLHIEDCEATQNNHEGMDISSGRTGMRIHRLHTHGNGRSGLKIHCGTTPIDGAEVIGVLSEGNNTILANTGIITQDWENSLLANSTSHNIETGALMALQMDVVNSGNGGFSGNKYHNLILVADYVNGVARLQSTDAAESNATLADFEANNTWSHNCLWQHGANTTLIYFDDDTGNNVTETNFATWVASHPGDINVDPLFEDYANGNFRLRGDSPCIGAGTDVEGATLIGLDGLRAMSPPSMGAYEVRTKSGYARTAGAMPARVLPAGVDMAKARIAA